MLMSRFVSACTVSIALVTNAAYAGSTIGKTGSQASGALAFTIVIPRVLIVDPRSGTVYTNGPRAAFALGAATSAAVTRGSVSKLRPFSSGARAMVREG